MQPRPAPLPLPIASQLARFASVGGLGFCADLGMTLFCARILALDARLARAIAIICAVALTFLLNRRLTFQSGNRAIWREALRYCLVSSVGGAINYASFHIALRFLPDSGTSSLIVAVALGSVLALASNFAGSRLFAFAN